MPVEQRPVRRRGGRPGRLLLGVLILIVLAVGAVTLVAALRHSPAKQSAAPPAPPPPPVQPVPPSHPPSAAVLLARAQQRAITRLAGLGVPVFCGAAKVRDVALTFDDGPGPYSALVLGILRRYHAQATFFLVGNRLRYWPTLPRAEAELGALGDHTWDHADLTRLPRRAARAEINRARTAIATASGAPVRLFRTPYGREPSWLGGFLAARGMLEIRWTIDSNDYVPRATAARILRRVSPALRPGAIVLLHDIHPAVVRALPRLLALIRSRHLEAVSVPELLRRDPPDYRQLMADNRGRGCVDLATARRE